MNVKEIIASKDVTYAVAKMKARKKFRLGGFEP